MMSSIASHTITRHTLPEIASMAPAVFGARPARHMTERYQHVKTAEVLSALMDRGYTITSASQERARKRDPKTVRHMVTMVHSKALSAPRFKEGVPTLLLWNSHNGRSQLKFCSGFFRFICSNGLIIGEVEQEFAFRHAAKPLEMLDQTLDLLAARTTGSLERMTEWRGIELSNRRVVSFAEKAAKLRFGEEAGGAYSVEQILHVRRPEDAGNSLWRVMNRVQENLMRGGVEGRSANGRKIASRAVNNITLNLSFNKGLWSLAEQYAEAA